MKLTALIILSFACNSAWASDIAFGEQKQQVANKDDVFCAIDFDGLKCWDTKPNKDIPSWDFLYIARIPILKNPQQVVMDLAQACVLDDEGIKCWGKDVREIPKLNNPTQLSLTNGVVCATAAEGVKCSDGYGQGVLASIKNPLQVETTDSSIEDRERLAVCIRNSQEVRCWKYNRSYKKLEPINGPSLRNPRHMSIGTQICAVDDDGVKCWGIPEDKDYYTLLKNPQWVKPGVIAADIKNPLQVTSGSLNCVLETTGVQCWGQNSSALIPLPNLKNPYQVYNTWGEVTCAMDDAGVKCWDASGKVLDQNSPLSLISIATLREMATPMRAQYLAPMDVLSSRSDRTLQENFLLWALISPAVLSVDSQYYSEKLIPAYRHRLKSIGAVLSYKSRDEGLQKASDTSIARSIALESIRSALSVAGEFLSMDQQTPLQDAIRACGVAAADPMNNQKILGLLNQVDAMSAEKQKLKSSPKSAFLVDSLELAANWLREKVK